MERNREGGRNRRGRGRNLSAGPNRYAQNDRTRDSSVDFQAVHPEGYGGTYNPVTPKGEQARGRGSSRGQRGHGSQNRFNGPRDERKPFKGPRFGFRKLEQLLGKEIPEEAILELITLKDDVFKFINSEMTNDGIVLLVRLFASVSQLNYKSNVTKILNIYTNDEFVKKLENFMMRLPLQTAHERKMNHYFWDDINDFWKKLGVLCNTMLDLIPKSSSNFLPTIFKVVLLTIPNVEKEYSIVIDDEVKVTFENLQVKLANVLDSTLKPKMRTPRHQNEDEDDEFELFNDFHEMSIYPRAEELLAKRSFGIRKNKIEGGYHSVEQYLDIQFRLLREDFVAPLRQGIAEYLAVNKGKHKISNIKVYTNTRYLHKQLVNSEVGYLVQVFGKGHLRNVERTKRLMFGSLVGFTEDNFKTILFGKVIDRDICYLKRGQVVIGFHDNVELEFNKSYTMIECLVYFEPYYHVLTALQQMNVEKFPMKQYLVEVNNTLDIPGYVTAVDSFNYTLKDLSPLDLLDNDAEIYEMLEDPTKFIKEITYTLPLSRMYTWPGCKSLGLNNAQYEAFRAALSQKFCIIQGPPGTGKTYLGLRIAKVLLENREKWSSTGPMLVICFTNHALDQFLEGLISATEDLVRVGGQSKNEKLQQFNLRNHRSRYSRNVPALMKKKDNLKNQGEILGRLNNEFKKIIACDSVMDLFNHNGFGKVDVRFENSWFNNATSDNIQQWLLEEAFTINLNLEQMERQTEEDDNEYQNEMDELTNQKSKHNLELDDEVIQHKEANVLVSVTKLKANIESRIVDIQKMDPQSGMYYQAVRDIDHLKRHYAYLMQKLNEMKADFDNYRKPLFVDYDKPFMMRFVDRWQLYKHWLNLYKAHLEDLVGAAEEEYRQIYKEYEEVRDMYDAIYMKKRAVIGMTTTGAARLQTLLVTLCCPIVIVEEAAEVLEAHIVSALTEKCQQLILIGDHKQLRPSTADFHIDKKYNLGISLFERMILNRFNCNTLDIQHRMRPQIAKLVCPTIYPKLENHDSVLAFRPVRGVEKSLYFLTHTYPEKESSDNSKENKFEATFLIMLANYFVLNGYDAERITILCAYSGQFFCMLKERKNYARLQGAKITILDNYQGEENDLILLSLVRNNDDGKIGFLKLENRVCVALSRAKFGLFIMGNINMLSEHSDIWPKIKNTLEQEGCVGTSLPLRCHNHPNNITMVSNIEDFNLVPEGGCMLMCEQMRDCGHKCPNVCHILPHSSYTCFEPCLKILCEQNHNCPKLCNQECGNCLVPKMCKLKCGHEHRIPCYQEPDDYDCPTKIWAKLECKHEGWKKCHEKIENIKCEQPCDARIEPCGHACLFRCHIKQDPDHIKYECNKACERQNKDCSQPENPDHKCRKYCSDPCSFCLIEVKKKRTVCTHSYVVPCHTDVNLLECKQKCRKLLPCGHACKLKCFEECGNCQVMVPKTIEECGHEVIIACSKTPKRKDCTKNCEKMLKCGHKCLAKCNLACELSVCKVLVTVPYILSSCGHKLVVPCYMKDRCTPDDGLKHCTEPCLIKLSCKDRCGGTCGKCHQGRLHLPCKQKCNSGLVCGHDCNTPCRSLCQPCPKSCSYKCKHSKCMKKCGDPCTNCIEKCRRSCVHSQCTKYCFQKCDIDPCSEPCKKNLKCGHACIGFCGDKCPPLCKICDKDIVQEIFFGTETDAEARFVYLEECEHVLEGSGLDHWFATVTESSSISVLYCPKCKTVINETQRYSDYIKESFKDLQTVKKKFFGDEKQNKIQHRGLKVKCTTLTSQFKDIGLVKDLLNNWVHDLGKAPNISKITNCQSKVQILDQICDKYMSAEITKIAPKTIALKHVNFLLEVLKNVPVVSNQVVTDFELEMKRLTRITQMCQIMSIAMIDYETLEQYQVCKTLAFSFKRYSDVQHQTLKAALQVFSDKTKTGLNITDQERRQIVSAIGLSSGHWFKCPKGHVYAIGECGGAMQESRCPECGAAIGGTNHALLRGNALAPEMDNARYAAYSDLNNLANFNIQ